MSNAIVSKATDVFSKASFKIQKHSPEILLVGGVVGFIASGVMACRATLKVNDILEDTKEKVDKVHEVLENEDISEEEYSEEDSKKDLAIIYAQTGLKFVKLYGPSIAIGAASIASIFASHNVLNKRNIALAAAYTAVDRGFKDYRKNVVERFGEQVDKELKYNLKSEKITETVTDEETGKEKKVKKTSFVMNPGDVSEYARYFGRYTKDEDGNPILNPNWKTDNEYNLSFLKAQERYANDLLRVKKRVFLNEVYEMIGLPRTKAGQIVGWTYNPEDAYGDNYIDFGLYLDCLNYSDFVDGYDPCILLDFNVDGNVWESM